MKSNAPMELGGVRRDQVNLVAEVVQHSKDTPSLCSSELFDPIADICFKELLANVYLPFKKSDMHQKYVTELHDTVNHVGVDDFEYMEILGQGGFGRVVHARKKTTGVHCAMKIQLKTGLLAEHRRDLEHVDNEKSVFAKCHHPFIVDMHYALQSSTGC